MAVRVLCSGDIHIGRRSSKVRDVHRTADAWSRIVDCAIEEQVDLLALSGDLLDKENATYEAIGPLQSGIRRLAEARIPIVAVAGNHDHDTLSRLATIVDNDDFRLLGQGGRWERFDLLVDGAVALSVVGWSFPQERVTHNPLHSFSAADSPGTPLLGLLHADVPISKSNYAPVMLTDFWATEVDAWLLGHIHRPQRFEGPAGRVALYPGSPLPMDPGEPGVHGVWLMTFEPGQPVKVEQIEHAPIRYVETACDVTGVEDEVGFQQRLTARLGEIGRTALENNNRGVLRTVSCRIHVHGTSPVATSIEAWTERARADLLEFSVDAVRIELDTFSVAVRPPVNLERLESGTGPLAETARLLVALNSDLPLERHHATLLEQTKKRLELIHGHLGYAPLLADPVASETAGPTDDDAREVLLRQGWSLLSALLAQKDPA